MAAPVVGVPRIRLAPGPNPTTPEQAYWKSFKSHSLISSPSNHPITFISAPSAPSDPLQQPPDSFAVTTGSRVQIFSIRSRKLIKTISRFDDEAHSATIRKDGRVLVAGDEGGKIQVFDVNSRAILKTWTEHKLPVWTTKFSPVDSTTLMSASDDRTVRLWDLPSQESTTSFAGHTDYVRCGTFMEGQAATLLVSGSYDQSVRIWDPRAPSSAVMTFQHGAPVEDVLSLPSGTTLVSAADNEICVLDIVAGKPLQKLQNHQRTVTTLSLASSDSRLVAGGLDGHVKVFETAGWNMVYGAKYSSPILSLKVVCSGLSRDDRHLVVGMESGLLSIKTRLSGKQKVREKERQMEMDALLEGKVEEHDKKIAKKKRLSGLDKRLRGTDFSGEGADVIIQGNLRKRARKLKPWEQDLRNGNYRAALDNALEINNISVVSTALIALRHRFALKTALAGRDEITLQPVLKWLNKYIIDPRYVQLCVEVGTLVLDLYSGFMCQSKAVDALIKRLHGQVRNEVDRAQQAWQTDGMIGLLLSS